MRPSRPSSMKALYRVRIELGVYATVWAAAAASSWTTRSFYKRMQPVRAICRRGGGRTVILVAGRRGRHSPRRYGGLRGADKHSRSIMCGGAVRLSMVVLLTASTWPSAADDCAARRMVDRKQMRRHINKCLWFEAPDVIYQHELHKYHRSL